ncbi:MAG: DUF881 domain-containing protein [Nocardioides sp.]
MPDSSSEATPELPDAETPSGRQRLLTALFAPTRSQIVVAVLLALVGFAGVTQVRDNRVDDTYSGLREQDLIDVLNGLAVTTQRAESEITRLEVARDRLQSDSSRRQEAIEQAETEAETLSILAGLVPVTGPGIRITIKEITGQASISSLLDVVQELRTVGAEAIQFNAEVRIVAQSSFEDRDGGIVVDGILLAPPYVIDVIGEPNLLSGAITFVEGPRTQLEDEGAEVEVQERTSLDIEAVRDPEQPDFAEADPGQ